MVRFSPQSAGPLLEVVWVALFGVGIAVELGGVLAEPVLPLVGAPGDSRST